MADATQPNAISFKEFLESVPPNVQRCVSDLGGNPFSTRGGAFASLPELVLYCPGQLCDGPRYFKYSGDSIDLPVGRGKLRFVAFNCKNCSSSAKTFALWMKLGQDLTSGEVFKYGEVPAFGPPTPSRVISLIGPQRELFLKGRRAEIQGLGIAAFAYYRRVIEDQKDRIFDEIIRVCKRVGADQQIVADLERAKSETQFSTAVETIKHGIPQALLINGQNPLTLLHSALSQGLHAETDEECLDIATSIRVVMADFADRMGQALKEESELTAAISRLLAKKSSASKASKSEPANAAYEASLTGEASQLDRTSSDGTGAG